MKVSERTLKWIMRLYPPLLFQRIWVQRFHKDFMGVNVKIIYSLLNKNYNSSIFGGTIYAASDPFFAVLFDQIFRKKGYKTRVWLKSASIAYIKPGRTTLYFQIKLTQDDIEEAKYQLDTVGKFIHTYSVDITDKHGQLCAKVMNEVYVRNLNAPSERETVAY
ncbi:DUF4442 domain-containing protein [Olivibacter ginsenosidimutans]|uniref:DUF4442 domain-containing protein n=1 Tax=Olivibacter ginsenosidimutans TaxID=1176537 RepID=A0ABP9AFU2_9SPHI